MIKKNFKKTTMIEKGDIVYHVVREIHGYVITPPSKKSSHCVISDMDKELIGLRSRVDCHAHNLEIISKREKEDKPV